MLSARVNEHDILDFICPPLPSSSPPNNDKNGAGKAEALIVSMVSEMSFLNCQLDSNAVDFLICDDDDNDNSMTESRRPASARWRRSAQRRRPARRRRRRRRLHFRQFSSTPDALVFQPGASYYFICKWTFSVYSQYIASL